MLETDLELPGLLSHVIDEARSLTDAHYGALGILNQDRTAIVEFLTVGLAPAEEERIGPRPTGRGVLGLLISDPRTLRLSDLNSHPESFGFPSNHPPMGSFLGVPIKVRDEVYGSIYLTNKRGSPEFTEQDEALVEALSLAAGMAIENTRLHQRVQDLAVMDDRNRMARDLHDTVIQHLYAVGISLETIAGEEAARMLAPRLEVLISEIGEAIRQVRSSIYELGLDEDHGVRTSVLTLVRSLRQVVGFNISVSFDGPIDSVVSTTVAEHLLATIREAVTNIGRHSGATEASVAISVEQGGCRLQVSDNGHGFDVTAVSNGRGLVNLQQRADKLNGRFAVEFPEGHGTQLVWQVPVSS
jgi:signal transduction histidine kinase